MDIILVAGLWLQQSVWADVAVELERLGHRPLPVALPGVDDASTIATLDDQLAAVLAAVDAADRPLVVGHSAASTLAWLAADRRPEAVAAVVMIGGFPSSPDAEYAAFFEMVDGVMPFPGWEPFDGPDSADLDDAARARLVAGAVAVPEGVAKGLVQLVDERRFGVPVVMVCPEYSPEQAQEWMAAGAMPELSQAGQVSFVNIDSGHWPMVSTPGELARLLHAAAASIAPSSSHDPGLPHDPGTTPTWTLGCDANDPQALAAFWALALGYVSEPGFDEPDVASIVHPAGLGPAIGFLRVPEGKTAKNRMHIDIRVAGDGPWDMARREQLIRAKVPQLVAAGASVVREEFYDEHLGHVVMLDPEGNEFCVA